MTLQTLPTDGNTDWFTDDRFGLFIHWGTYALAARHEWVKSKAQIDDDVYDEVLQALRPGPLRPRRPGPPPRPTPA
jgi:alpha-L-fucosidase